MGHLETVQFSGNLLQTVLEARAALGNPDLLQHLLALGHPYGVILSQLSQNSSNTPSLQSESSGGVSSQITSADFFNAWSNGLQASAETYLGERSYNFSSFGPISQGLLGSISVSLSLDASSGEGQVPITGSFLSAPFNLSSHISKEFGGNKDNISIHKNGIAFGTVSLNLTQFKGRAPFVVKTSTGEPVAEIQSGSPLAFLHLNRQASTLRQMSPLERIQTMTKDLKAAFGLIDNQTLFEGLKPEQQAVLTAARSAVIVGISHLVPLFRRKTELPVWKLDVLPQAVQQLHRLDSQAESNQFGGHRQVRVEDVEMMVITPQMRQQLAAVYA